MFPFISQAHAQAGGAPPGGELFQIGFLVLLFVLFYFIAIRPQRKRQKEHQELIGGLQKGDEVVTTAGILGKITKVQENYVVVKVTENVELKFQKASIHGALPKGTLKAVEQEG